MSSDLDRNLFRKINVINFFQIVVILRASVDLNRECNSRFYEGRQLMLSLTKKQMIFNVS